MFPARAFRGARLVRRLPFTGTHTTISRDGSAIAVDADSEDLGRDPVDEERLG